jgi:aminopeptidase YwaD
MKSIRSLILCIFSLSFSVSAIAQVTPNVIPALQQHISLLASDSLEGREAGTPAEMKAADYIISQYKAIGLTSMGDKGYLQPFTFTASSKVSDSSYVQINNLRYFVKDGARPHPLSANRTIIGDAIKVGYGIVSKEQDYDDYKNLTSKDLQGKVFVMNAGTPDNAGPHSKYANSADMRERLNLAKAKGAVGVVLITQDTTDAPPVQFNERITPVDIPVYYAGIKGSLQLMTTKRRTIFISMRSQWNRNENTGHNVIGWIDNRAENTIVIGAHYDHLGMGEDGSLYRGNPLVHNGADDNASGVAAMIELARLLKNSSLKNNNYMFIAFSGEEKGLLGSNAFVRNPTQPLESINYMLNMDMVGRLKRDSTVLIINGAGTSDAWKITFNYIAVPGMKIHTTESGVGPSDHTSFYLKDIPVLHFFSGTHRDYHKPSDDERLINYDGVVQIMDYMYQLMSKLDDKGKLQFVKTKDDTNENAPRFKVTLGVIPDYSFEGRGMRIDGVSDGKPAFNAGMKSGDVVIKIGDLKVEDMGTYMKALGAFEKGQKAKVIILRGGQEQEVEVTF